MNLNIYRNTNHFKLSKAKREYFKLIKDDVINAVNGVSIPIEGPVSIEYNLYPARTCDVSNVLSIVDKFTLDTLVKLGILIDDNIKHVPEVSYIFKEIDKINPRVTMIMEGL